MGRQLFEKEGLYLHKQPWKGGGVNYRKKDRMREQEMEKERERERRRRRERKGCWGSGLNSPSHSRINPVTRIKYSGQGFGPRSPQSKWKITGCE